MNDIAEITSGEAPSPQYEWAEESDDCVVRVRGRFPCIGYIDGEIFTFPKDPVRLADRLRQSSINLFTFLQPPDRVGILYPQYHVELDNLAVLQLSSYEHWWKNQVRSSVRTKVNKAHRAGMKLEVINLNEELLSAIHAIYNETPIRQGQRFTHYGKTLAQIRDLTDTFPQRSVYISARLNGAIVGFLKLVTWASDYAAILHVLSFARERLNSPTNALIAEAVRICTERKISQLSYGHYQYGNKRTDGLLTFKLTNGFQRLDVPRYYIPLNLRGYAAMHLGLHRRLRDRVPEPIASVFRSLRSLWYARFTTSSRA